MFTEIIEIIEIVYGICIMLYLKRKISQLEWFAKKDKQMLDKHSGIR